MTSEADVRKFLATPDAPGEEDVRALLGADEPTGAGGTFGGPPGFPNRGDARATVQGIMDQLATIRQGMFVPGAADEASAAVRHPIDFVRHLLPGGSEGPAYVAARDAERAAVGRYRKASPVGGAVAELLGGAATGKYLPTAIGKAKGVRGLLRASAEGAGYAGVAGAASAEGGAGERMRAGVKAAPAGAALAPVLHAAIPAASGTVARVADLLGTRPASLPRPPAGAELRTTAGGSAASGIRSTDERANEMLVRALETDNPDLAGLLADAGDARGPVALMDLGGDNLLGVARGARSVQGSTAKSMLPEALRDRVRSQEERIIGYALKDTGIGKRTDILGTADDLAANMAREAEKSYGAIRGERVTDKAVITALKQPAFRRAYERAAAIRENEIAAAALTGERPPAALPPIDDLVTGKASPTLGTLDQVKRGLDDVIYSSKREGLGKAEIASLQSVRHAFVDRLDEAVPAYRDARSTFAGQAALRDALEEGGKLFDLHPDEATRLMGRMGSSEREMFRKGALEALMRKIEGTSSRFDLSTRRPLDDVTLDRKRLRLLFDDPSDFDTFQRAIKEEARMAASNRFVTGGSNTVDKLGELASIAGVDLGDVMGAMAGKPSGMVTKAATALGRHLVQGYTQQTADALAPKLVTGANGDQAALRKLIEELIATQGAMRERAAAQAGRARGITGAAGGLLSE